jgi:CRP/FNR family cyclic AMP-dependent transcriptional regulator
MPTLPLAAPSASMSPLVAELAERGKSRRYPRNALLIHEGDQGDTLFIIIAGRLRAYSADSRGHEITYGSYGPGEYVGEMSLDGGPRSASVITLEPSTCAMVTRETLQRFIADQPEFAFEIMSKLIRRARAATLTARQMALNDVYGRLQRLLDDLAIAASDGVRTIHERLTHRELASRIGCSREMVSRLMKDLERGRYVEKVRGGMVLRNALPPRW